MAPICPGSRLSPTATGSPNDGFAYRVPQISVVDGNRFVLVCTRFETDGVALFNPESEALQRPELCLFWSDDGGTKWTDKPQIVDVDRPADRYTWNSAGQLLQLRPDRWLWPMETWKPKGYEGAPDQRAWALFSTDQGGSWGELTVVADDPAGRLLYWDQMNRRLDDGRLYTMLWPHAYGTSNDLENHWVLSQDDGHTWSAPQPTNLRGQVCCPIPLQDGRVAAIYNDRQDPQGIRVALTEDLSTFDIEHQVTVFDAGAEATLGDPQHENFLAEHMLIAFGKPGGRRLQDGSLLIWFWCTVGSVTHTRWARLQVS